MPVIPTYDAKAGLDPDQAPHVNFDKSQFDAQARIGGALEGVGSEVSALGEHIQQRQNEKDAFNAQIGLTQLQQGQKLDDLKQQQNIAPDGTGWADSRLAAANQAGTTFLSGITNPKIRDEYAARVATWQATQHTEYAQQQLQQQNGYFAQNIQTSATNAANAVLNDPAQLDAQIEQQKELIAKAGSIPILDRLKMQQQLESQLQMAYVYGLSRRDPAAAQAALGVVPRPGQPGQQPGSNSDASAPPAPLTGPGGHYLFQLAKVESGGNPNAQASTSSAKGLYQFTTSTWDGLRREYPQLGLTADGRDDPAQQQRAIVAFTNDNASTLGRAGFSATPGNLYAAHFAGSGGAIAALKADPNTPIENVLGQTVVSANPFLKGKTAGQFLDWASNKMGGGDHTVSMEPTHIGFAQTDPDPRLASIPFEKRLALATDIARNQKSQAIQAGTQQKADHDAFMNQMELGIHDGKVGLTDIQQARTDGKLTDYSDINKLETQIAKQDKATQSLGQFDQAIGTPNFSWNPLNSDHRDMVDAGYAQLSKIEGAPAAAQHVVEKTGILPSDAGVALRGALVQDPTRAQQSLQAGSRMMTANPNVFAGMKGGDDFANNVATFNHYVNDLGFDAATASQKIFQAQQPEYQQKVKAKVDGVEVDKMVKALSPSDVSSAFNDGLPFFGRPSVGSNPVVQQAAMNDYSELYRMNLESGADDSTAKALAVNQMKRTWGVSHVTSSGILTRYPIDKAPAYAGIDNVSDRIADAMVARIKEETGQDVDRTKLSLASVAGPAGNTASAFKAIQPVPVSLGWTDDHGLLHVLPQPFAPDPVKLREQQTKNRLQGFQQQRDQGQDLREQGVIPTGPM